MGTTIDWATLTGDKTLTNGGYVGDLMAVARAHIDDAIKTGRLTQKEAGQVYSSMIPTAISGASNFILADALQAAQILGIEQDTLLKQQQVLIAQQELLLKTKQLELEAYRLTNILPAELAQLEEQTDVAERGMVIQEAQSVQDLLNKASQKDMMDQQLLTEEQQTAKVVYEVETLLPDQHTTNTKQQDILTQQKLTEVQHTAQVAYEVATLLPLQANDAEHGIELKQTQITHQEAQTNLVNKQLEDVDYRLTHLLPVEIAKETASKDEILSSTTRATTQLNDQLLTTDKQRDAIDVDILIKEKQSQEIDEQVLIAKQTVLKSTYEVTMLLPDQHNTNTKQQAMLDAETDKVLQATSLEAYRLEHILPAELGQLQKQTDVAERGMGIQEDQSVQDLLIKDKQILDIVASTTVKTNQAATELKQALDIEAATKLKTYENGTLQLDQHITNTKQQDMIDAETDKVLQDTTLAKKLPLLNSQLSAWSAAFNGGKIDNVPAILGNPSIASAYDTINTI